MAEGWARHLKDELIEPFSAGVDPHALDSRAVAVMNEAGVDISRHHAKETRDLPGVEFDYVITVCAAAAESCPVFAGRATVIHVGFEDPPALAENAATEEEALDHYRSIRDEIRAFVETLPGSIVGSR